MMVRGCPVHVPGGRLGAPLALGLKSSPVWEALVEAWAGGAVLAGSSAGAMVLGDTMVDPRGGALTLGLGLLPQLAVLPHANTGRRKRRTARSGWRRAALRIAAIDERTALLRAPDGHWCKAGEGEVTIWLDGRQVGLDVLGPGELRGGGANRAGAKARRLARSWPRGLVSPGFMGRLTIR